MRLRGKFALLLVPLIVAPLLILGFNAYREVREIAESRALEQMALVVEQIQQRARTQIDTALANVELFANHSVVRKYALTDDEFQRFGILQRPLLIQFQRFQEAFPSYRTIRFIQPDGFASARWSPDDSLESLAFSSAVDEALMSKLSNTVNEARAFFLPPNEGNRPRLIAATDLRLVNDVDEDPTSEVQLRGYLAITLDLSALAAQIGRQRVAQNGIVMLVDEQGQVLLGPDRDRSSLLAQLPFPGNLHQVVTAASGAPHWDQWSGVPAVIQERPVHGNTRLLAVVPESDITSTEEALGLQVVAIMVIAVLVVPALVLLVLERLVLEPLDRLTGAAETIGGGDLASPIEARGRDEVGALARSFDGMRRQLAELHEKLRFQAYHDSLTGLPNRRLLNDRLSRALPDARRHDERIAVMFLDLDKFKHINDTRGHSVGDKLLRNIAERLTTALREEDSLAAVGERQPDLISRIGGDEFIILVSRLGAGRDAGRIAQRLVEIVSRPYTIDESEFVIGASVGIAVFPDDGDSPDDLIRCADIAMYEAKAKGRNRVIFYAPPLDGEFHLRARLEERLARAIEEERLSLHFQPQVDIASGRIVGFEALARWRDEEAGWISPDRFVPLAEAAGMIVPLTRWVLRAACDQARQWQDRGLPETRIAVNVWSCEIVSGALVDAVRAALDHSGIEPARLRLEVTKNQLIGADENVGKVFDQLKALGIGLTLDDFGSGYASLGQLRQFHFDQLKIDRSCVAAADGADGDPTVLRAILAMARELPLAVVAGGVESDAQLAVLREFGCELAQGYLFSHPVDARPAGRLLAAGTLEPNPAGG